MSDLNEPYLTIKQVADALGVKYWQVQRAVKRNRLPSYSPFNSRKMLLLSEVRAAIAAERGSASDYQVVSK